VLVISVALLGHGHISYCRKRCTARVLLTRLNPTYRDHDMITI